MTRTNKIAAAVPLLLALLVAAGALGLQTSSNMHRQISALSNSLKHGSAPVYSDMAVRTALVSSTTPLRCPATRLTRASAVAVKVADTRVAGLRYRLILTQHMRICSDGHTSSARRISHPYVSYYKVDHAPLRGTIKPAAAVVYTGPCHHTASSKQSCTYVRTHVAGVGKTMWGHIYRASVNLYTEINRAGRTATWFSS
jgi:hypothetical protein